jgi:hypothetical protein
VNRLHLRDNDLIAQSKTRWCYLHPQDPAKVIKIVRKKPVLWKQDANQKEWRHFLYLKRRHAKIDFITTYHGFVETNLGRGLISDCIRDADGTVSTRLENVLANPAPYDMVSLESSLDRLCRNIITNNIQLFDLNRYNILIQVQADGACRPISIDIKGRYNNYEFIPVSTYVPCLSRRKLRIRCQKLMDMVRSRARAPVIEYPPPEEAQPSQPAAPAAQQSEPMAAAGMSPSPSIRPPPG